jgi:hemerythrin-like metal-binding protein
MGPQRKLLATGLLRIDREHETLARMLERAESICAIANAAECTGCTLVCRFKCASDASAVMQALATYLREHFRYEEQQMDWSVPPDHIIEHRRAHDDIAAQVEEVIEHYRRDANPAVSARSLGRLLSAWLRGHAEEHDAVLATFIGDGEELEEFLID